jgi:hypothetical protein
MSHWIPLAIILFLVVKGRWEAKSPPDLGTNRKAHWISVGCDVFVFLAIVGWWIFVAN